MTRRIFRGLAAATLLVALSAGAASAGGWATIQADSGNPPQPNAGEPFTFGFTVLQHGVTPAGWETPTFLGINGATGERVEVKAVAQGADGHFVATVTLPSGGFWTWQVVLQDLIVETGAAADGRRAGRRDAAGDGLGRDAVCARARPDRDPDGVPGAALHRDGCAPDTDHGSSTPKVTYLESQRAALTKQVDGLTANPTAAAPASESVPLFAVVGIAVLAGAISGFAMTMLGRGARKPDGSFDGRRGGARSRERRPHDALTLSRTRLPRSRSSPIEGSGNGALDHVRPVHRSGPAARQLARDGRRRELLVEEAPETGRPVRLGDHLQPLPEELLALVVDEDVRPPERMLDELEALLGEMRRLAPDLHEVRRRSRRARRRRRGA